MVLLNSLCFLLVKYVLIVGQSKCLFDNPPQFKTFNCIQKFKNSKWNLNGKKGSRWRDLNYDGKAAIVRQTFHVCLALLGILRFL
jgi:hypothetical protein